jgi:hypothetical protein
MIIIIIITAEQLRPDSQDLEACLNYRIGWQIVHILVCWNNIDSN